MEYGLLAVGSLALYVLLAGIAGAIIEDIRPDEDGTSLQQWIYWVDTYNREDAKWCFTWLWPAALVAFSGYCILITSTYLVYQVFRWPWYLGQRLFEFPSKFVEWNDARKKKVKVPEARVVERE